MASRLSLLPAAHLVSSEVLVNRMFTRVFMLLVKPFTEPFQRMLGIARLLGVSWLYYRSLLITIPSIVKDATKVTFQVIIYIENASSQKIL